MSDALYDLLQPYLQEKGQKDGNTPAQDDRDKYLSRLLSLKLADLTTTEPQSLHQASHSNLISIQALSSRSHRTTTASSDHLATLHDSLPNLTSLIGNVRQAVPALDESAVQFASSYSRSKEDNAVLNSRKESMLLAEQADKLQDILELPTLLSAAIASAGTGSTGGANYSQALDLFAHIKRLQILYPESQLTKSVLASAEVAMKDMTTNLIHNLRSQNIRLAAAIRTIGWLRRVAPELNTTSTNPKTPVNLGTSTPNPTPDQEEGHFGALFLCARLCTFLTMTEALSPLRDLADQETSKRIELKDSSPNSNSQPNRRQSSTTASNTTQGQQTERYLKRYIEIFREQSFATISMYRNVFPPSSSSDDNSTEEDIDILTKLQLPSALSTFPLHLVEIFMETLKIYLPNITDPAARESILMQVLYAANSLGRLGADFSMMIALLDDDDHDQQQEQEEGEGVEEPEWARVMRKHRVQAARLEAMAAGQEEEFVARRGSGDLVAR